MFLGRTQRPAATIFHFLPHNTSLLLPSEIAPICSGLTMRIRKTGSFDATLFLKDLAKSLQGRSSSRAGWSSQQELLVYNCPAGQPATFSPLCSRDRGDATRIHFMPSPGKNWPHCHKSTNTRKVVRPCSFNVQLFHLICHLPNTFLALLLVPSAFDC